MTKEDWIKLALPASITLLAISIITVPMISHAMSYVKVTGGRYPLNVKIVN